MTNGKLALALRDDDGSSKMVVECLVGTWVRTFHHRIGAGAAKEAGTLNQCVTSHGSTSHLHLGAGWINNRGYEDTIYENEMTFESENKTIRFSGTELTKFIIY